MTLTPRQAGTITVDCPLSELPVPISPGIHPSDFDLEPNRQSHVFALNAIGPLLREQGHSHFDFYQDLSKCMDPQFSSAQAGLRLHMDGGSQVTTTDQLDQLWWPTMVAPFDASTPILKVADRTPHRPTGFNWLCVPTKSDQDDTGHTFIKSWYTPSLPVTIMPPPSAAGKEHRC